MLADDVKYLEPDWLPECLGENLFALPIENVNHAEKYVYTKFKISGSMIDINDFALYTLTLILNGTAAMYAYPCVPHYQREHFAELLKMETPKCKRTEDKTATVMKVLKKDKDRLIRHILIVFPVGTVCTTDFDSLEPEAPTTEKKVKRLMRKIDTTSLIGKKSPEQVYQHFRPIHWNLRILAEGGNALVDDSESSEDDLCDGFEGMHVAAKDDEEDGDDDSMNA